MLCSVFFRAFLLSYGIHFLQFGWLASCSCVCGAGQLSHSRWSIIYTGTHCNSIQLSRGLGRVNLIATLCARATNDIPRTYDPQHYVSALRCRDKKLMLIDEVIFQFYPRCSVLGVLLHVPLCQYSQNGN